MWKHKNGLEEYNQTHTDISFWKCKEVTFGKKKILILLHTILFLSKK